MVVQYLLMKCNPDAELVLSQLKQRAGAKPNVKVLAAYQNAAIHFQCLVTERLAGSMSTAKKEAHAAAGYRGFTAPGFMMWVTEKTTQDLAEWLDLDLMGKSTLSAKDMGILYKNGGRTWSRYTTGCREIKKSFNSIWDSFMVAGELPSGMQVEDAWECLQDKLWIVKCKEGEKIKIAKSKATLVVDEDDLFTPGGSKEGSGPIEKEGGAAAIDVGEGLTGEQPSPTSEGSRSPLTEMEKTPSPLTEQAPSPPTEKAPSSLTEKVPSPLTDTQDAGPSIKEESMGNPGEGGGAPEDGESRDSDNDSDCYPPKPDWWMHPYSLTFALFGRPSSSEDVDLKMKWTNGPADRKRKSVSGDRDEDGQPSPGAASDEGGGLNTRGLQMIPGAGESLSRTKSKNALAKERSQSGSNDMKAKLVEHLTNPAERQLAEQMVESVRTLAESAIKKDRLDEEAAVEKSRLDAEAAANAREAKGLARWQHTISALQMKIETLQSVGEGNSTMAKMLRQQLFQALDAPIVVPGPMPAPAAPSSTPAVSTPSTTPAGAPPSTAPAGSPPPATPAADQVSSTDPSPTVSCDVIRV